MVSFNRVILMGNVTRDPEVRYTTGGTAVTEVGLAINRHWTDRNTNEKCEEVTFVDVTLWGRTAEVAGQYLRKGSPAMIEGRLRLDQWDDRETGAKRSKLKVVGDSLQLLGAAGGAGNGGGGGGSAAAPAGAADPASSDADGFFNDPPAGGDDEMPF